MEFKEIHKGIDSLYLSYRGFVRDEVLAELAEKKTLAQSENEEDEAKARMIIKDHHFEVSDKGRRSYAFVIADGWYQIQISASKRRKMPEIYVQVSSILLNCMGLDNAMDDLRGVVSKILVEIEEETISRADIFVDFSSDRDFSMVKDADWITRAHSISRHTKHRIFTGFSIGMGGDIAARLYDKTVEIIKSNKPYFYEIWGKEGWEEGSVWRLEFQLRRIFLSQMSVNTVAELKQTINDIWSYCTREWLRLGINDDTENRSRWESQALWQELQKVTFGDGTFTGMTRYVDKARVPDDKTLFHGGIGYITSHAAKNGIQSMEMALIKYAQDAKRYLDQNKAKGCREYFKKKVNLKKKRFNKKS